MNVLSKDDLTTLLEERPGWHLWMFMPMARRGAATQQNPIRCKTVLRQAEAQLLSRGAPPRDVQELLQPVQQLVPDQVFWQRQQEGLALFRAPNVFQAYRLPFPLGESIAVTQRFQIKPLLPLLSDDGHFFVLALSQKAVRLFQGTRYSISEVELQGVPQGIAEALPYGNVEKKGHHYPGSQGRAAGGVAPVAGHGVGIEDATHEAEDAVLRYFQQLDAGLRPFLNNAHAPMVLAGVEHLLPTYHRANSYPYLLDGKITGNPEGLRPEELQERAWAIVQPHFQRAKDDAAARYRQLIDTGRAAADIAAVLTAAYDGRVETLFIAVDRAQWGSFDRERRTVTVHEAECAGDDDLLNMAAIYTLRTRGTV